MAQGISGSELLLKYGKHLEGCAFFDGKPECDCGFLRVYAIVSGAAEGSEDERRLLGQAAKPRVSFTLASLFIVLLLCLLSGGVELHFYIERVIEYPQTFLVGSIFAFLAIALLYEW